MVLRLVSPLFVFSWLTPTAATPKSVIDQNRHSFFGVEIELEKNVLKAGEAPSGSVIITSSAPVKLKAVLVISFYRDLELVSEAQTEIDPILPGTSKFSFQDLNLPLNQVEWEPGEWALKVLQQDLPPENGAYADFVIYE